MGRKKKSAVGVRKYGTKSTYSQRDLDEALQKFQIPVAVGKSVSVEEIERYIDEREESKKKTTNYTKKRGRPIGSKSQAKKKKEIHKIDDPQTSRSGQGSFVNADNQNGNLDKQEDDDVENSQNVTQTYEVNDGRLDLQAVNNIIKAVNRFCIVNYEGTLFPGLITEANHPKYKIYVMLKAEMGWIWPRTVQIASVNDINIIRVLNDSNIQRNKGYITIEDDFLAMEWGD